MLGNISTRADKLYFTRAISAFILKNQLSEVLGTTSDGRGVGTRMEGTFYVREFATLLAS